AQDMMDAVTNEGPMAAMRFMQDPELAPLLQKLLPKLMSAMGGMGGLAGMMGNMGMGGMGGMGGPGGSSAYQ
ncbi:hypothetical protein KIPB_003890, partial [Kipferlia bialata]